MNSFKVMTFNIRNKNGDTGKNSWENRKHLVASLVRYYSPDLLGVQEAFKSQVDYLDCELEGYGWIGVGREDGKEKDEYSAIFYKKSRFKFIDKEYFWLSETPDVPSLGWDAHCIRICTAGLFKDVTNNKKLWYFNTHLDHAGTKAMINGAKLLNKRSMNAGLPTIVTGDFNQTEDTDTYKEMISGSFADTKYMSEHPHYGNGFTFHDWKGIDAVPDYKGIDMDKAPIDYIFVTEKDFAVYRHATITDMFNGQYPSDHFPVIAEIEMK
jgi:endonuclease/exonuclease/phosphatase family metal-dependent hydrolase